MSLEVFGVICGAAAAAVVIIIAISCFVYHRRCWRRAAPISQRTVPSYKAIGDYKTPTTFCPSYSVTSVASQPAFHQARLPCGAIAQTVAWSAPRSMALHSVTASQCAFTQPPPADGPAFPPATSRPAVGSGKRPPLIQASCPTSYH
ncbi:hypothetical protein ACOMHN_058371 [Nucella lapillus]